MITQIKILSKFKRKKTENHYLNHNNEQTQKIMKRQNKICRKPCPFMGHDNYEQGVKFSNIHLCW